MRLSLPAAGALAALFFFFTQHLPAQSLSFGVKAGVPATDAIQGSFGNHAEAPRYTVGPMLELGLPFSFGVEVDALYRRTGYSTSNEAFGITNLTRVRANSWEFPILLKYYLPGVPLLRPYVSGGYVGRRLFSVSGQSHTFGRDPVTGAVIDQTLKLDTSFLVRDNPTHGVAIGGGVRLRLGPLKLAPEVRYTYWTGRPFDEFGLRGFFVQSPENQVDFLVGLTF